MNEDNLYYIKKGGWYYQFDSKGYTMMKSDAGKYTWEEVKSHTEHCTELGYEKVERRTLSQEREKAEETINKHYMSYGDGYLGSQHYVSAELEIVGIIKALEIVKGYAQDTTAIDVGNDIEFYKRVKDYITEEH